MKMIFSDLDGTLLDHNTYSFGAALEGLARLKELNVPLILCSSKTRREIELLQGKLGIETPFIAENGGAIYFRKSLENLTFKWQSERDEYRVLELGEPRSKLRKHFLEVNSALSLKLRSFSDMTVSEVMELTSLPEEGAKLAMEREYSEPFIIPEIDMIRKDELVAEFVSRGLKVVKGGRFFHLMGQCDKGLALKMVSDIYMRSCGEEVISIALGDNENDIAMLEAAHRPVLVKRHDGSWLEGEGLEAFIKTEGVGPAGWNEAVLDFLGT